MTSQTPFPWTRLQTFRRRIIADGIRMAAAGDADTEAGLNAVVDELTASAVNPANLDAILKFLMTILPMILQLLGPLLGPKPAPTP